MHSYNDGRLPYSYGLNISLESTGLCRLRFLVSEYYFEADYISGLKGDCVCSRLANCMSPSYILEQNFFL